MEIVDFIQFMFMLLLANMHTMPETIERAMHIYRLRIRYLLLFLYCLLLAYGRTKIILYGNEHIKMKNTMQYALNQTHWRVLFILMVFFFSSVEQFVFACGLLLLCEISGFYGIDKTIL